jgi:hypothetical protein
MDLWPHKVAGATFTSKNTTNLRSYPPTRREAQRYSEHASELSCSTEVTCYIMTVKDAYSQIIS